MTKHNINFSYLAYGREKDVCIAQKLDSTFKPYAVVRHPNLVEGYWSHAIGYYKTWEEAVESFWEYMAD